MSDLENSVLRQELGSRKTALAKVEATALSARNSSAGAAATGNSNPKRRFSRCMAAKGWTVPAWPKEYGGGGLSKDEVKILKEEMRRLRARSPLESFGIWMLGPALLKYGTHEQKAHFLPPIARGEIRWCQGYSEPNAGSDLASLQCKCEDKGDHWLINGQKIWTSYADHSDWIFVLVRTDPKLYKHPASGHSVDMTTPALRRSQSSSSQGNRLFCEPSTM
ncbi:MAG: acyl-CoA dehydrogenase family protein [Parvularculaceae bacterium]